MTISYPLILPDTSALSYRNFSLKLDYAQASSESPFTLKEQIYSYEAERWVLNVSYPPLTPVQAKQLRAFILSLKGRIGTFKAGDPQNASPAGNPGNNVKINGSHSVGAYTMNLKGLNLSTTKALAAGDDLEVNGSLYTVLQDVNSNGSGQATVDIMPGIRTALSDNTTVIVENPRGTFRLDDAKLGWSGNADRYYDISIAAVEAL